MDSRAEITERGDLADQLAHFRAAHRPKTLHAGGTAWEYFSVGEAGEIVLILPGLLGLAEMAFPQILALQPDFRVIAVSYPFSAATVEAHLAGICAILEAESAGQVNVLGASYGGMLAQSLVRKIPERIRTLILAHTGPPVPERAEKNRKLLWMLRLLPLGLLRALLRAATRKSLMDAPRQRDFWQAYSNRVIANLGREDLLARYLAAIDFDAASHFTPHDLERWPGRVLILEGDNDPIAEAPARAALKGLYPQAQVHTFHGTGHVASIARVEAYIGVVREFIARG